MNAACMTCGRGTFFRSVDGSTVDSIACDYTPVGERTGECSGRIRLTDRDGCFIGNASARQRWRRFVEELRRRAQIIRAKARVYRRCCNEDPVRFARLYSKVHAPPTWLSGSEQWWSRVHMKEAVAAHLDGVIGCRCRHAPSLHGHLTPLRWSPGCRAQGCPCHQFDPPMLESSEIRCRALGIKTGDRS